jgi:hypothetical protein
VLKIVRRNKHDKLHIDIDLDTADSDEE